MSGNVETIKLLLMGDSGTGKSCILLRFCDDKFAEDEAATIGVDFRFKYLDNFGGRERIKLTIWDTAGQERFRSLTSSYYRGAQGVILVYDVTRRETFDSLKNTWLKELEIYADLNDLVLMIVGNKIDLENERQVSYEEGLAFAQEQSALFMESSARTRVGIKAIFEELVLKILNRPAKASNRKQAQAVTLEESDGEDYNEASLCGC